MLEKDKIYAMKEWEPKSWDFKEDGITYICGIQ